MIKLLKLENYRGFKHHTINFKNFNIVVGTNNAGKSTIVEALSLVAAVLNRYKYLTFKKNPNWWTFGGSISGFSPSIKELHLNYDTIFYHYDEPPSIISVTFDNNIKLEIYLAGANKLFGIFYDKNGKMFRDKKKLLKIKLPQIGILPQIGPVRDEEEILTPEYVRASINTKIGFTHFRNQINLMYNHYNKFQNLVNETWPGVMVLELIGHGKMLKENLYLHIRNEDFVAEIGTMGHGLQMWLQTMWFLTRSRGYQIIILDEPDVYMHADLQRKLVRLLKDRFSQTVITTHSVEIISEVETEDILIVDKYKDSSTFANKIPQVQDVMNRAGSIQNIHITKLWKSRKFVIVEGKDIKYLKLFQNKLFPNSPEPFDSIPHMSIGGWGGWNIAIGSALFVKNSFGDEITNYCIFDKDYHTKDETDERIKDGLEKGVQVHIWSYKEIENYFIIPQAISRMINEKKAKRTIKTTVDEIEKKIGEILSNLEDDTFDLISTEFKNRDRSITAGSANKFSRDSIKECKRIYGNILPLVSGKFLISKLSEWSQEEFGVSFSPVSIIKTLELSEIPLEITEVIGKIERSEPLTV